MNTRPVTYNDHTLSKEEVELTLAQALNLFESMVWQEGSFLYFEINNINVFQIIFSKKDIFLIEITNDSENMTYFQKYADYKQSQVLLIYYFNNISIKNTNGFYKVPVNTKTLDDVLIEKH